MNDAIKPSFALAVRLDEAAIRADEREKCAKVCEDYVAKQSAQAEKRKSDSYTATKFQMAFGAQECASAIRGGKQP